MLSFTAGSIGKQLFHLEVFRRCLDDAADAGKIGASDVLVFRREFVEGQRQYVEALFEAQSARIALDLATGRTPIQLTPTQETQR